MGTKDYLVIPATFGATILSRSIKFSNLSQHTPTNILTMESLFTSPERI